VTFERCRDFVGTRAKRASLSGWDANDSGRTFKTTSRFKRVSRARYTSPIPPGAHLGDHFVDTDARAWAECHCRATMRFRI
jgi:hypothetical protein